jgi:hypothetical protein
MENPFFHHSAAGVRDVMNHHKRGFVQLVNGRNPFSPKAAEKMPKTISPRLSAARPDDCMPSSYCLAEIVSNPELAKARTHYLAKVVARFGKSRVR